MIKTMFNGGINGSWDFMVMSAQDAEEFICEPHNRRIAFISIALAVFGIAFIAIGPAYLRILGLQLIVADLCAVFTSYSFTGILWGKCKGLKKSRKTETKTQNN